MRVRARAAAITGYWPGAWKAAVVVIGILVIRLPEIYPRLALLRPSIIIGSVIGLLLMQRTGARAWRETFAQPAVRWLAVYLAAIVITIPFAIWPGGAFTILKVLPFMGLIFVTLLVCQPTRKTLDDVLRWTVLLGGIYAAYVMTAGHVIMEGGTVARLGGMGMYDPNDLAMLAVIVFQLGLGLSLRERAWWRLIGVVAAIVSLIVALKTASRGGMVALGVGTLTLLLAQKPARFFMLATGIALATPFAWMFGPESFRIRAASFLNIGNDYTFQTDAGRWVIWQRGLGYFMQRPIIGVGPGGYGLREGEYFASQGRVGAWLTAHNTYLQVLVEVGVIGGLALSGLLWSAIRGALPLWRRPPSNAPNRLYRPEIFAALMAFLAGALFLSHAYNPLFYFSLALATYSGRVHMAESDSTAFATRRPRVPPVPTRASVPPVTVAG